jgi:phosphoenolpyruvate phosphomutase
MVKTVYVRVADDVLGGDLAARIATARQYGEVVIGLVTDRALSEHDRLPCLDYECRRRIVSRFEGVKQIVPQEDFDGLITLRRLQSNYYVCNLDTKTTENVGCALAMAGEWDGQVMGVAMGPNGPEVHQIFDLEFGLTPAMRLRQLRRLLAHSDVVRVLEVHSPLCGIVAESATTRRDGRPTGFDAMWSSSLTDSTVRGKPDIELVDHSVRLAGLNELFDVTTKPLLYDGDTGGRPEHFGYTVRSLERLGVSAVVIEDKIGLKRNSLLGNSVHQEQDSIDNFCYKISAGKAAQATRDFAIIGRIESFVLNAGLEDALERARAYVSAGADGIMIHSCSREPDEIFSFCDAFRRIDSSTALVVAPTSYGGVYETELQARGVNVVVYANHLLRASYPAMVRAAQAILEHGRCREADAFCMSIEDVLQLISGTASR